MIATYVNALEYIESLNRKAHDKKTKERALRDATYRRRGAEPKPVFSIDLPANMVDLVFHERQQKTKQVPESQGTTTTKPDKKRVASQKAMTGEHKDKSSSKQKTHKTVKVFPGAFDNVLGETIHEIKQDFYTSPPSQTSPKPILIHKEKIEYFKVTHNGQEHLRERFDSAKVLVGINGHPPEEESIVKSGNELSRNSEKRIPLSWEDQLSNFPEEVKTVKQKDPVVISPPKNYCENYRIYSHQPSSKIIWRKMMKPSSSSLNQLPSTNHMNPPPEQNLPSSPSFIKGGKLKSDLASRYILHENVQEAMIGIKLHTKMELASGKTPVERAIAASNEVAPPRICELNIAANKYYKARALNHDIQDQSRTKNVQLKKRQKSIVLPVTNPKPLPRDPKVMGEFFHVTKMDNWLPGLSGENKTRKSGVSLENNLNPPNNQDICHNNGVQIKSSSSPEKENHTMSSILQTGKGSFQVVAFTKPLSIKGGEAKITTQEVQVKGISVNCPSVIHFRIPYCGYVSEHEMPDVKIDQLVMERDSQKMSKSTSEASTGKRFPDERYQTTTKFTCERPNTI